MLILSLKIVIEGNAVSNGTVSVVVMDVKISTDVCEFHPPFAMPG